MNTKEINPGTLGTIPHYLATVIPMTAVTAWVLVAAQSKYLHEHPEEVSIWSRLAWPLEVPQRFIAKEMEKRRQRRERRQAMAAV